MSSRRRCRLAVVTGTHRFPASLTDGSSPIALAGSGGDVACLERGDVVLMNRHGLGERTPVHRVDHAGNVAAVAAACDTVLAVGSCGSLRADLAPGTTVAIDDVFAPWSAGSLFDDARAESLPGFDVGWRAALLEAWGGPDGSPITDGGVYVQSPGPRFETPAEIRFYAGVGDVIGMTLGSEMVLAREAGLSYAAVAMVDNLANGIGGAELFMDDFESTVVANRDRLWSAVLATVLELGYEM